MRPDEDNRFPTSGLRVAVKTAKPLCAGSIPGALCPGQIGRRMIGQKNRRYELAASHFSLTSFARSAEFWLRRRVGQSRRRSEVEGIVL